MAQAALLEFADKMNEIMPIIMQGFARRQVNELYKGKITLPQFLILDFLSRQGESRMTDMARFMQVTTAAMTGIIDRLVRDSYCTRVYNSEDRRIVKIKLTAKGNELVKKINAQKRQMLIDIFGKISEEDRKDYLRILLQIKEVFSIGASTTR
ncbi:MAG: MarR family transcriptional regulator [Candidatus Omnitrophota bacterium]